jgi:hypothetical protein
MDEKTANFQLLEPSRPESLIPSSRAEPWILVAATILVLAFILVIKFRKKPAPVVDLDHTRQAAYKEASSALNSMSPLLPAREAAVSASLILRNYLASTTTDSSLFETHEETRSRDDALSFFTPQARLTTLEGFAKFASAKYAKEAPHISTEELLAQAATLLETLHHGSTS